MSLRTSLRMATMCINWLFCTPVLYAAFFLLAVKSDAWNEDGRISRDSSRQGILGSANFSFVCENFITTVESTLTALGGNHRPLLIHTRDEQTDVLVFVRENNESFSVPLVVPSYSNLKALSHLPVSAVTTLLPELAVNSSSDETREKLQQLQQVLEETMDQIKSGAFEEGDMTTRQTDITEATSNFIDGILGGSVQTITLETLRTFAQSVSSQLRANAKDAVKDYLTCLNETITSLLRQNNITATEWEQLSVVIALEPFVTTRSFIVQYYTQLFNSSLDSSTPSTRECCTLNIARGVVNTTMSLRIILSPACQQQQPNVVSIDTSAFAQATLTHNIIQVFYNSTQLSTTAHDMLSDSADEIICSEDLDLPSCPSQTSSKTSEILPPGFETQVERVYVIVVIYTGTVAAVLAIILSCICVEGRKMKFERRGHMRREGPNVFTPIGQDLGGKNNEDFVESHSEVAL